MRLTPLLLAAALAAGCASSTTASTGASRSEGPSRDTSGPAVAAPAKGTTTTWTTGMVLRGTVTIPAGSTVTLAKDAVVTATKGSALVVAGTLLSPYGGKLVGEDWAGVTVAKGGTATLSRLDLSGGGLTTDEGAGDSSFSGTISHAGTSLSVGKGSTLTLKDTKVHDVSGVSIVKGTLEGDRLSYDQGSSPGIVITGALRLRDSVLFGDGDFQGDMLTSDEAQELTLSRTEIKGVHCAFHLVGVGKLTLDDLKIHDNAYGFMAYGSDPAQVHRITNTDVYGNRDFGLSESPGVEQGRIVVDGGYWGDNGSSDVATLAQTSGKIERLHPKASRA